MRIDLDWLLLMLMNQSSTLAPYDVRKSKWVMVRDISSFPTEDKEYPHLTQEDMEILDTVIQRFGKVSKSVIVETMHKELPECTMIHPGHYPERFIIYVANPAYCVI